MESKRKSGAQRKKRKKAPQAYKAPWGPALGRQQGLVALRRERNPEANSSKVLTSRASKATYTSYKSQFIKLNKRAGVKHQSPNRNRKMQRIFRIPSHKGSGKPQIGNPANLPIGKEKCSAFFAFRHTKAVKSHKHKLFQTALPLIGDTN